MSEFVVLNKADYKSILPLDVVAFHHSTPGACGYHGVMRMITKDRRLYMVNYLYDSWPHEDINKVCPPFDGILTAIKEHHPLPSGWIYSNMGLGNTLFVNEEIRKDIALHGLNPAEIYQQWDRLILDAIDRIEQCVEPHYNVDLDRIAPEWIDSLDENEIFVFGSNILGYHLGGASEHALIKFGATYGQPIGIQGKSYAIPTDGEEYYLLRAHISRFINYAREHPELKFLVTKIGCGTAGYSISQIAPFFQEAVDLPNILLPLDFWKLIL